MAATRPRREAVPGQDPAYRSTRPSAPTAGRPDAGAAPTAASRLERRRRGQPSTSENRNSTPPVAISVASDPAARPSGVPSAATAVS